MRKIVIVTLGCKVNQYESASFHSAFEERGHQVLANEPAPDIVVVNTCSVTQKAENQSKQLIRKALRQYAEAKIIITGCYTQLNAEEVLQWEECQNKKVSIIGNGDKNLLVDKALAEAETPVFHVTPIETVKSITNLPITRFGNRTRAYLRIQDGCNSFCTYCIVPHTRGRSRSLEVSQVLLQADIFAMQGYKEIVLTGIHIGYYGADLQDNIDISSIVSKLCSQFPEMRFRLSSIEPLEITPALLNVMSENTNFMPHLHIPLQSGSDDILLRMNRRYNTSQFSEILNECRTRIDDLAIGIDVLVGFPGETEKHFEQIFSFLQRENFTYLHIFPYSKRTGTPAAQYADHIEEQEKEKRVNLLRKLSDDKKKAFYRRFIGSRRKMLVENTRNKHGFLRGFTDNYIPVSVPGEDHLKSTVVSVEIQSLKNMNVQGSVVAEDHER